jgi:hypothetical protein
VGIVDAVNGDGYLLAARSGEADVDVALGVNRRTGDGMQIVGDRHGDVDLARIAAVFVGGHDDVAGGGAVRHTRHQEIIGTHNDRPVDVASEVNRRAAQILRTQAASEDADFAARQSAGRFD